MSLVYNTTNVIVCAEQPRLHHEGISEIGWDSADGPIVRMCNLELVVVAEPDNGECDTVVVVGGDVVLSDVGLVVKETEVVGATVTEVVYVTDDLDDTVVEELERVSADGTGWTVDGEVLGGLV